MELLQIAARGQQFNGSAKTELKSEVSQDLS